MQIEMRLFQYSQFLLMMIFFLYSDTAAQDNDKLFPHLQRWTNILLAPLAVVPTLHESGHALMALSCGADSVSIHPFAFPPYERHFLSENVNFYALKKTAVYCGGFIATRLSAELINYWLDHAKTPRWLEGVGGGLYFWMRFDLYIQCVWGLSYAIVAPGKVFPDFSGIVHHSFRFQPWTTIFYVLVGALIVVDIYFTRDLLTKNYKRAMGKTDLDSLDISSSPGAGSQFRFQLFSITF